MGLGTKAGMVFCYANSVCGFFVAYLFDVGIQSMAITAAAHKWDRAQKARACRHAALLYLVLALALTARCVYDDRQAARRARLPHRPRRLWEEYDVDVDAASTEATLPDEALPLLSRRSSAPLLTATSAVADSGRGGGDDNAKQDERSGDGHGATHHTTKTTTTTTATTPTTAATTTATEEATSGADVSGAAARTRPRTGAADTAQANYGAVGTSS